MKRKKKGNNRKCYETLSVIHKFECFFFVSYFEGKKDNNNKTVYIIELVI